MRIPLLAIEQTYTLAAQAIANADTLLITAGAGLGVDSGLPDFRGNDGFWCLHPLYAQQGLTFADLANPYWFSHHPEWAWGFYGHRYHLYQNTMPHAGFAVLKKWLDNARCGGFVYTSNVDGQFQKAGFDDEIIYECHGSIHHLQCTCNCNNTIWSAEGLQVDVDDQFIAQGPLPLCPDCGRVARPNILMFNDDQWLEDRSAIQWLAFDNWQLEVAEQHLNLVVIEIGAGFTIGRVRYTSESMDGKLIRINPQHPQGPKGTLSIALPALEALQGIDAALEWL